MTHSQNPHERVLWQWVVEHLSTPVVILDRAGLLLLANTAARSAAPGLTRLFTRLDDERLQPLLQALRRDGSASAEIELAAPSAPRRVLLRGFAVESWFVISVEDAAHEAAVDEELRQLRRVESVSLLAASAVHDLSNLLAPILCLSSMLSRELADGSRTAAMAAEIEAAATRASSLVRDVLTFARGGSKNLQAVNANTVVAATLPLLRRLLGDGIELVLALDEALGQTLLDRSRLEHSLLNLAINARNAMPRGGRLTIRTANVAPDRVALVVSDNGVGMSEGVRQSAFGRFFTTRDAEGGTGLGLASVQRFALESGGSVKLESELGKGTTVTLELPRLEARPEPAASARPPALPPGNDPAHDLRSRARLSGAGAEDAEQGLQRRRSGQSRP